MNITIVAPYCSLPSEPHFNRFWYLAELLSQSHDVLLITSNFKHYDKSFRRPEDAEAASQGRLKVMLLEESGYSKNVSLGRVTSHHRFVKHFEKWLENCRPGEQDVVFSAYPLIATNLLLGKHKARLGYKLIVDVQDVWPESFSSVVPFLKKIPHNLLPFASRANQAYRYADALVAVSQTYLDRAKEANPNVPGEVVSVAKGCDISVNAIHSYAMQSITNKLSDYMALQKPILNSQVNDEVAEVLTLLPHADYRSGDVESFVKAAKDILKRKDDPVQSEEIVRRFKRDVAYQKIVNLIERLAHE